MPSPVGHSIIGLALGLAWRLPGGQTWRDLARAAWSQRGWLLLCVVLANAPDVDFLFGLARGNLNAWHQQATHTLAWTVLAAGLVWLLLRRRSVTLRDFLFILALPLSHLLADLLCADTSPPVGLPLAWPFSEHYGHAPVSLFPAPAKASPADLVSWHNARVIAAELLLTLPLLAAVLGGKLWTWILHANVQNPPEGPPRESRSTCQRGHGMMAA